MSSAISTRAFAPASIGNFAVGFDTLGAALAPLDVPPWATRWKSSAAFARRFCARALSPTNFRPSPKTISLSAHAKPSRGPGVRAFRR